MKKEATIELLENPERDRVHEDAPQVVPRNQADQYVYVRDCLRELPNFKSTSLHKLRRISRELGLYRVWYKDESTRFDIGSFKALGGAYGVFTALADVVRVRTGKAIRRPKELLSLRQRSMSETITVCCASDGNHGRAVAWAARLFGCRSVVYIPDACSGVREAAIAAEDAQIVRVHGTYELALSRAITDADQRGWLLVSDTAFEGYEQVPQQIMLAYQVLVEEVVEELQPNRLPTHIFVQAGAGGLAAALCAFLWERMGTRRPVLVVVESRSAACLFRSAAARSPVSVPGPHLTVMSGLACGKASTLAWRILRRGADFFISMDDSWTVIAMRHLATRESLAIFAGESGAAGLGALMGVCTIPHLRAQVRLSGNSSVLLVGTEGATDPERYRRFVGFAPERIGNQEHAHL